MTNYERLKQSERNRIIANFQAGKPEPDYEVIPSKNQPGKFTIRRKVPTTSLPNIEEHVDEHAQEGPATTTTIDEEEVEYNAFNDDNLYMPQSSVSQYEMFCQMQMMMNKMFVEQFKVLRKDQKRTEKKRKLIGQKAKTIHDVLIKAYEQNKAIEEKPEVEEDEITETIKEEIQPEKIITNPDVQNYDQELNNMRTPVNMYSRRNNIKSLI